MRIVVSIISVLFFFGLTGCASRNDAKINESFDQALNAHNQEQTQQVQAKVEAIKDTMTFECSDGTEACGAAKAMSKMFATQNITQVKSQKFTQPRPKTGVNIQDKAAGYTGQFISGVTTLGTVKLVTDTQPTTTYNNEGDVKNAGNRSEAHTTTSGDNNDGLASDSALDGQAEENTDNSDNSTKEIEPEE